MNTADTTNRPGTLASADPDLPFFRLIDAFLRVGEDVKPAVERLQEAFSSLRDARLRGQPPTTLGGVETQAAWEACYPVLEQLAAVMADLRYEAYRAAVDERGLTLTELSRVSGRSRQRATLLVKKGRESLTGEVGGAGGAG